MKSSFYWVFEFIACMGVLSLVAYIFCLILETNDKVRDMHGWMLEQQSKLLVDKEVKP